AGDAIAWNLHNYECAGAHVMFHIRSAGGSALNNPDRGQLHRSVDQGATWTDVTPSSGNTEYVGDVAMDADENFWCIASEYARKNAGGTQDKPSRIYKSVDWGATWALSYLIPDRIEIWNRDFPAFNITCHPTNANIIVAEGTEMIGWGVRLWRTTDGGASWSMVTPTFPSPPTSVDNVGGARQHVFDYTLGGDLVYAGIFEISNDNTFVLKSLDDGDTFNVYHTEADITDYGAAFHESTLVYIVHRDQLFESASPVGPGQITKIADNGDSPFGADDDFHGMSRHAVNGVDTLHLGLHRGLPGTGATDNPSVWTRPADLSSGWIEHPYFDTMESDLGYRVYVAIDGIVGATEFEGEPVRPPRPESPPVGPSGGEAAIGIAEPTTGIAEPPKGVREKRRSQEAPMRLRRRQEILPPEDQVLPPRAPSFLMGDRIDKHQPIGLISPSPKIEKWLSFGWLTPAVLAGQKTLSLRDWGPVEAQSWQRAQLAFCYDKEPSKGGNKMALLRISHTPYKRQANKLRNSEFYAAGLMYAQSMGLRHPKGLTPEQIWSKIKESSVEVWVVRYRVEQIYDQLSPTRGNVRSQ
ncbi:hypothetical protein LCGC14_2273620, partial [marine sediment metagenome]